MSAMPTHDSSFAKGEIFFHSIVSDFSKDQMRKCDEKMKRVRWAKNKL
jgi:hypothetical protein